ncbi:MAG: Nif3-like dinuclear metal center hexameric protein [Gammaproteobacteria bacterium]|nr:Nif3-like dinuclear metal center hexameric protein [Gammaproteobacteria bacterium]
MFDLADLAAYTNKILDSVAYKDYCPNGLQIAGCSRVDKIVSGVSASLALAEAAIAAGANVLLVHHGYFWKGENPCLTGIKRKRIGRLLAADVSLLAYHLPLDAHPIYGNNVQLAKILGIQIEDVPSSDSIGSMMLSGSLPEPVPGEVFAAHIARTLGRPPLHIAGNERPVRRIAWCSGSAQGYCEQAAQQGADAYLTGEISEQTVHVAREYGIHFYAAGHHATERYGVKALGNHLAKHFGIAHEFIDIDNPV